MRRTNIVLDEKLVHRVMKLTGARTKRQAVDVALRELAARGEAHGKLLALAGRLRWKGDLSAWRGSRG
ncbi:MAG: type II toxin-antitoxin system VapB family antitoxin [Myxococcota bacterium]